MTDTQMTDDVMQVQGQVAAVEAPAQGEAGRGERHGRSRKPALIVAGAAVLALLLAVGAFQVYLHGRVPYRVSVLGRSLGGTSEAAARQAIAAEVLKRNLTTATFSTPKGTVTVPISQLGLSIDVSATAARAVRQGRLHALGLGLWWGGGGGVEPVVRFDAAAFQTGLAVLHEAVDVPARDATLKVDATGAGVKPAVDGTTIDTAALARSLQAALAAGHAYSGTVPTTIAPASVSTATASAAADQAQIYFSQPLNLRYRGHVVELTPSAIAGMVSVNTGTDASTYPLTFDNPRARAQLHRLFAFADKPAVNAGIRLQGKQILITPSHEGYGLDMPRLLGDLDDAASQPGLRVVDVPLATLLPTRTTSDVQAMGLTALGSEFSTYYDPTNKSRATNIVQAAKIVDGTLIHPGEVFSLNATLGPRTLDRGFDYAPVIVDGVLRQGVGGGICQFATTLFNAAFFAGLPIVERHPHDFFIDHYPIGRDAQVAWGSQDLSFKNDTPHSLMVRCWAQGGQLTVVLVGSTGRTVTFTTSKFYDVHPSGTSKAHPRVVTDATMPSGQTQLEQGYPGETVRVVRTVMQGGKVLIHDTYVSTYAPKDWIRRVGTG